MTSRDLANLPKGPWTGDVWKLIPILQKHRPDLKITVLDSRPTGLVLVSNLNPASKTLPKAYDRILADWENVDLAEYGAARFNGSFVRIDPESYAKGGYADFGKLGLDQTGFVQPTRVTK